MAKSINGIHRDSVKALMRREHHLRQRIAQRGGQALTYDLHEAAALHWAIQVLSDLLDVEEARIDSRDMSAIR